MTVAGHTVFLLLIVYFAGMWFSLDLKCCPPCKMRVGFDYYLNFMIFGEKLITLSIIFLSFELD